MSLKSLLREAFSLGIGLMGYGFAFGIRKERRKKIFEELPVLASIPGGLVQLHDCCFDLKKKKSRSKGCVRLCHSGEPYSLLQVCGL